VLGKNWKRLGTPQAEQFEAAKTRVKKGVCGELASRSKMTAQMVLAIREEYAAGGISYRGLAKKYGMSTMAICSAVKQKSWKSVE